MVRIQVRAEVKDLNVATLTYMFKIGYSMITSYAIIMVKGGNCGDYV